jgi:hypothetical protein
MLIFTDADRTHLTEMCAITTNSQGQEVLVGLTLKETEFYMEYSRQRMADSFPSLNFRTLAISGDPN